MTHWRDTPIFNASFRKVGGIFFWKLGRFGGSFYLSNVAR